MFLYPLIDISVLMPIISPVLWLCFASMCRKAVKRTTTGTLGRAEAEIQLFPALLLWQPLPPAPAWVT